MTTEEVEVVRRLIAKYGLSSLLEAIQTYCKEQSRSSQGLRSIMWRRWDKAILDLFQKYVDAA